jgi:putative acetyltransferase
MIDLRREQPEDAAAIREVLRSAFGRAAEADLADALREAGAGVLSLVACEGPGDGAGPVVGHVLFTPVTVTAGGGEQHSLLGLAPVAVTPAQQGRGAGTMLVEAGLEQLRGEAFPAVVVLGDPGFYGRFGFLPADMWGLSYETPVPAEHFMAVELSAGSLTGISGVVRFRPEFAGV